GLYVMYVVILAIFRPKMVPALPLEARIYREPNGSSGTPSLTVLAVISAVSAVYLAANYAAVLTWLKGTPVTSVATDEKVVVSLCAGVLLAFVIAVMNKVLRLGLLSRMAERVTFVLIPPLFLIFLVLGTIFLGVATPTEGGAMGALGALAMAFARRRLSFSLLKQALNATTKLSCFVMFILIGATIFGLTFQGVDGPRWVEHLLTSLPGGQLGFLIVVNILIFVLAFFLDFFELSFIVVPLLAVNMQTSFMHPPFGFALFFLRSVAPDKAYVDRVTRKEIAPVTTGQIYWGAVPFVAIQLFMVGLIIAFPGIVSHDKVEKVDLDKVKIEIPTEPGFGAPPSLEGFTPGGAGATPPADDEQKKIDELFAPQK
ncbi:MAG: TRAP transporter large permease subunit, partial [Comamonadaceae bacterium]